ncbi:DUF4342 domain-containing protein [Sphingobacterium griseoflavum]|uniref:DUF4342 domain-containing protein n=1 Tax=Sphingobacterium griseoflavum TaxID=1474952 RepID=A0ABQ3HQI2_9SPHI|nr:DUF4342 domain-containing protein [Sphingobacterium griseoflavum]GHE23104.1 hypothetical protein GCM10017764_00720 [Sphingobacterium griseoflavum]
MKTKTTFNLNSENISNAFQKAFDSIQETKLSIQTKSGKERMSLPLLIAIVIAVVVPFAAVVAVILALAFGISFSFQKNVKEEPNSTPGKIIQVK